MERKVINTKSIILTPLLSSKEYKKGISHEEYVKIMEGFERSCEKSLIKTLSTLSITSMVKTDPYSLPYNNEIVIRLMGESYLNGPYEFHRVARKIAKELLNKDIFKIRFYLLINIIEKKEIKVPINMGAVEYRFRYYI